MKQPILVISTDDGMLSNYTLMLKEMRRRGLNGTDFVIGSNPDGRKASRLPWEYLNKMHEKGQDIQCHTYTHSYLDTITPEETAIEMDKQTKAFADAGLPAPKHTAYPGGRFNDANRAVILQKRETTRFAQYDTFPRAYNTYEEIKSTKNVIGIGADIQTDARAVQIEKAIDATIANKGVLVTYWHGIIDTGETPYEYAISKSHMIRFLNYVVQKGIRVMTYSEMLAHVNKN